MFSSVLKPEMPNSLLKKALVNALRVLKPGGYVAVFSDCGLGKKSHLDPLFEAAGLKRLTAAKDKEGLYEATAHDVCFLQAAKGKTKHT